MDGSDTHRETERRKEDEEEEKKKEEEEEGMKRKEEKEEKCDGGDGGDGTTITTTTTTTATTTPTTTAATTPTTPIIEYSKKGWGVRHTVVSLACLAVVLLSMTRYNLSIAIVSMVGRPPHAPTPTYTTDHAHTLEEVEIVGVGREACPAPVNVTVDVNFNETSTGFEWDERQQGLILGAFYYGNILTNILGGRMAERIGSKPVILLGMFLSSTLSLLSPLAAHLSTNVFIGVRLAIGFAQGIVMPAISRYLVLWVPPFKRSKYTTFVFIGSEVGVVLSLSVGGWLCSQTFLGGWPAVFYVFGGAGVVWCLAWVFLVHESPENHTRITSGEKKYLMTHCVVKKEKDKVGVPWSLVVRSLPFWSLTIMHVGYNFGFYTFVTELPNYLANVQHFSIKSNGLVSALPYLIKTTFALLFSVVMDRLTARGKLSVLSVRRMAMVVASYLPAAGLIGMCFVGCDSMAAVAVMSASIGVTGSAFCGLFCSHQDISPHFAGTIYGVTNSLANITGFIAPAIVGVITFENQTVRAWNIVFLLSSLIYVLSCTFYITCISDQVQPFNTPPQALHHVEDGHLQEEEVKVVVEKSGDVSEQHHQSDSSSPLTCKK